MLMIDIFNERQSKAKELGLENLHLKITNKELLQLVREVNDISIVRHTYPEKSIIYGMGITIDDSIDTFQIVEA